MIATGYIRRSAECDDKTVSLYDQSEQIERYCQQKGFALVATVYHDGVSGGDRDRWEHIHHVLKLTESTVLVFPYLDRLARDSMGLLVNAEELTARGIQIHETMQGWINPSDPTQKLMLTVRSAMDENYRNVISYKTKSSLKYKREKGEQYTNIPPLGYTHCEGRLVKDPLEQVALQIIERCRLHGFGARRTKKALLNAGYHGRMGLATIHRLLHSLPSSPALP